MGHITCTVDNHIATLTIANTQKANCLSMAMLNALSAHIDTLSDNDTVRAIVLTGAGDRFFCAGADIKEWGQLSPDHMSRKWIRGGHKVYQALRACDMPTVCVLNGHAYGGGLEMALMCDYRLAVDTVEIGLPEAMVGTIPGWLASEQLAQLTSIAIAKQMILFGENLSATQAQQHGIISKVCPAESLDNTLHHILDNITVRSPYITSVAKRLIHATYGIDTTPVLHEFAVYMTGASDAGNEGKNAFIEKRPAHFTE